MENECILLIDLCMYKKHYLFVLLITYLHYLSAKYRCSDAKDMLEVLQKYYHPLAEPKYWLCIYNHLAWLNLQGYSVICFTSE